MFQVSSTLSANLFTVSLYKEFVWGCFFLSFRLLKLFFREFFLSLLYILLLRTKDRAVTGQLGVCRAPPRMGAPFWGCSVEASCSHSLTSW